jgi:hypothetical protein
MTPQNDQTVNPIPEGWMPDFIKRHSEAFDAAAKRFKGGLEIPKATFEFSAVTQDPELPSILRATQLHAEKLHSKLLALRDRLSPVLTPKSEVTSEPDGSPLPPMSELSHKVMEIDNLLSMMEWTLDGINDQLAL